MSEPTAPAFFDGQNGRICLRNARLVFEPYGGERLVEGEALANGDLSIVRTVEPTPEKLEEIRQIEAALQRAGIRYGNTPESRLKAR